MDLSYGLQALKLSLQLATEEADVDKKDLIEGVKKAVLSLEEAVYFTGDDDFGGSASIKKLWKIIKRHGAPKNTYNQSKEVLGDKINDSYAPNGLIFLFNTLNDAYSVEIELDVMEDAEQNMIDTFRGLVAAVNQGVITIPSH